MSGPRCRRLWLIWIVVLGGAFPVVQAPGLDGLSLDPHPFQQDGLAATQGDVGRGQVVQALVLVVVNVVLDEGLDLGFEVSG